MIFLSVTRPSARCDQGLRIFKRIVGVNTESSINNLSTVCACYKPFLTRQILDASKLKEFADDTFKFDTLRAISPFPTVFSEDVYYRDVKLGLVWERVKTS